MHGKRGFRPGRGLRLLIAGAFEVFLLIYSRPIFFTNSFESIFFPIEIGTLKFIFSKELVINYCN